MIDIDWANASDEDLAQVRPLLASAHEEGRAVLAVSAAGAALFQVELRLGDGDYATHVRLRGHDPVELVDRALDLLRIGRPGRAASS